MKIIFLIIFCSILAQEIPASAFYRTKFEKPADDHYEFQGGHPHRRIFKSLILARFDPEGARDKVRFYLRGVVDHLARGPVGHDHGRQQIKFQNFSTFHDPKENKRRRNMMTENQRRARKFFTKHHRRNLKKNPRKLTQKASNQVLHSTSFQK